MAAELRKSWLSVWDLEKGSWLQLADDSCETVMPADEGNAQYALGMSNQGYRIEQQWKMDGAVRLYLLDSKTGKRKIITERANRSTARISPAGNFVVWYDPLQKNWISYHNPTGRKVVLTKSITVPLYDEEHDTPSDPPPHGLMGWKEGDERVYIYDKYDIWELDPNGQAAAKMITLGWGRKNKISLRNEILDREQRFLKEGQPLLFQLFDHVSKGYGWKSHKLGDAFQAGTAASLISPAVFDGAIKAKESNELLFLKETPASKDLWLGGFSAIENAGSYRRISELNPQQQQYNWFTVELHKWKMLNGKMSEGLLYKPENFDSTKKYPVIFYFYEKNADRRYNYLEPMPVRASVNIAYYTSNGYLVFDPNIYYKTGQPGEDAYNSVVSAARHLAKFKYVDSTKMGLQGHSWGGYQIAYLITRTNMFAAAEAGAPVSNMTSAYGGIRWGTGISRQFQYEKTQSRIGATLWEKPELYIKNSPLFRADKVKTPLLMLHNDKDDAVPWYQGIEYFTALRRLGKPVWMINYNDELHGINERKNRKDWTIRMAQFFDHYLKGAPEPVWMKEGVPATLKGISWGLD
jgi:dipeptidyl aminopeptidase/acylaminoacyl peptidase